MPVSPQEFSLWARMTGNKYPNSVEEKARLAPEVHNFSQNVGKQGALGVQEEPEPEQKSNLGSKLAKGALIAGGIAAGVAAARNPGVQEAVKTASGKASDFLSKITTPREVNVDTAEAVRDVTNSAPGDTYSQAIIPTHQRVEGYAPAGLLKGGGIGGAGDRAQSLIAEIASKYGTNGADEEYVHPSRIPGMPGGDYRGKRIQYSPQQEESFRLNKIEGDERTILQNEGEIPPGMLTREQQAYLDKEKITNALDQIKAEKSGGMRTSPEGISYDPTTGMTQDDIEWNAEIGKYAPKDLGPEDFMPGTNMTWDDVHWNAEIGSYAPKEQSLSNKADAVISALGAADPEFGHTQYAPPESVEAANANPGQNPINTALSSPQTPDNDVTKIKGTFDQGTLTGQRDIEMAANNAVDQLETDIIAIRRAELEAKKAQIAESTGISNPAVDRFLGKYFPSMTETYDEIDIASGRIPERTVSNIGPEAGVTKAASGGAIRGRSRIQQYEPSQERTRDISPEPEELRGTPLPEDRPDIIGGRLPLGGVPGDLDPSQMSKQEVIQSIINPSTVDLRDKTPIPAIDVYGEVPGYGSGAMKASGEWSDKSLRKPTDLSPAEAKYAKFSKDPYAGLSDEALQTHIQNARPGSPSQQGLQREVYRRSGAGIPISQKMREIYTTGDPLTKRERAQAFLDELRRNQQG